MKVQFLGATETVTGSRYLVTHGKTKILVDCGLFQGFKTLRLKNWDSFPVKPHEIDVVLLTHAHLDHSGYIPLLVKNGFRGSIYATSATIDLCKILLPDSGYLQEEEAKFANKKGYSKHHPALALYTYDDATESLKFFVPARWKEPYVVGKNSHEKLVFEFHPAGHLLGAASLHIRTEDHRLSISFSGDIGRTKDPLVRPPEFYFGSDDLVIESTYGNRKHPEKDPQEELKEVILRTINRKGILLIPSFAVGRAQLILYYLLQLKRLNVISKNLPIYLNSPMASQANKVFENNLAELKISSEEVKEIIQMVKIIGTPEESMALNERTEPAIIIAASGMATGGRVLHHLKTVAPNPNNTILFVGFQAGGTRGDMMVRGVEQVKIHGEYWPIRAEVVNMETLSAHADADEILNWIRNLERPPKRIFVTHGEPQAADALRHRIEEELHISAIVPEFRQEIEVG